MPVRSNGKQAHEVGPGEDAKQYSTFTGDLDLCAKDESEQEHAARFLRVEAVGQSPSLVLELGPKRTVRTFTVAAGWELRCQIAGILNETANVTRVTVGW
jgi:hypothetical protein